VFSWQALYCEGSVSVASLSFTGLWGKVARQTAEEEDGLETYPTADHFKTQKRLVYFRDPEGNLLELCAYE